MSQVIHDIALPRYANFDNLHLVEKNSTPLSLWQRYNQRPYAFIKQEPRKAKFINCVKVIVEHKALKREPIATADNRRFYFSERLVSRGPDRVRQPIP